MNFSFVPNATEDRVRAFAAELSRLLIIQGFDVDITVRSHDVKVTSRLYQDGKRAGYHKEYLREWLHGSSLAPMSIAIMEADEIRRAMPEPS